MSPDRFRVEQAAIGIGQTRGMTWRFSECWSPASSSDCSESSSHRGGDRDNIPLWLTVLCGIGGVLIGYYLAAALGVDETRGIDWIRWIISIIVAAILVVIAATVTGRRTGRRISPPAALAAARAA